MTFALCVILVVGLVGVGWQLTFLIGELKLMRDVITYRLSGVERTMEPPPWIGEAKPGDVKFYIPSVLKVME
jgi:hypothetical protein